MSKESRLLKNTAIIALGNFFTKCISFFMLPLYTSILTTEEYGTADLIGTYSAILIIVVTLQLEQGVFRFLVESRGHKKIQSTYISYTLFTVCILSFICMCTMIPLLYALDYEYTIYLVTIVVCGSVGAIIVQIPRGLGNNALYAQGSCLNGSLNVALNVVFVAVLRWGIDGILIANICAVSVSVIYIILRTRLWQYITLRELDKSYLKILLKYSLPLIPYTLCWWVVGASDRMLIDVALGTAANGIYAAANKFPSLFGTITGLFQISWTESAAENINDRDRNQYYQLVLNKSIRFYSAASLMIIAVMPFVFNSLIDITFSDAYFYIPLLMIAALLHAIAALYGSIYFAFKATREVATTTALAALLNVIVNCIFIRKIGLYAAALSSVLAYGVILFIRYFSIRAKMNIKLDSNFLLREILIYLLVFGGYYSKNSYLQLLVLIVTLIHSFLQNKEVVVGIVKYIFSHKKL